METGAAWERNPPFLCSAGGSETAEGSVPVQLLSIPCPVPWVSTCFGVLNQVPRCQLQWLRKAELMFSQKHFKGCSLDKCQLSEHVRAGWRQHILRKADEISAWETFLIWRTREQTRRERKSASFFLFLPQVKLWSWPSGLLFTQFDSWYQPIQSLKRNYSTQTILSNSNNDVQLSSDTHWLLPQY